MAITRSGFLASRVGEVLTQYRRFPQSLTIAVYLNVKILSDFHTIAIEIAANSSHSRNELNKARNRQDVCEIVFSIDEIQQK